MTRTLMLALLTGVAPCATSCGRVPLDWPEVDADPAPVDAHPAAADAGRDATDAIPGGTLAGIWSGQLPVSASGFAWGPFDRLTLSFDASGAMTAMQFASNFPPPHIFGPDPPAFPLQGTRDVPLVPNSIFPVRVTSLAADFARDHFHVRHRVVDLPGTPETDYVEDVSGRIVGDQLRVEYAASGTLLTAGLSASASGDLGRN